MNWRTVLLMQSSERFTSWKEIAAYLECDERTAQRWEAECGLPVHRMPGRKRGSVFAFKHELDEWLKQDGGRLPAAAAPTKLEDSKEPVTTKERLSASSSLRPSRFRYSA